jgi:hypothetical protein
MKKAVALLALVLLAATMVFAAPNPSGTGQPNQSCESQPASPPGFLTSGFDHAKTVYAGAPGTPSLEHGSSHAVAQYDVACFQLSQ